MIEVELKFPVESLAPVRGAVLQKGIELSHVSHQSDEYFDSPLRNFAEKDLALRIRTANSRYWLTFKGPNRDKSAGNAAKMRSEIELELPDEQAAEKIRMILLGAGFSSAAVVRKKRETYEFHSATVPGRVEICLDEVSGLGSFIEFELLVDEHSGSITEFEAKQKLLEIAISFDLSNPITTSYLDMLLRR